MKKQLTLTILLSLAIAFQGLAQTYNMANGTITTCSGTFYDNGGLGLYGNNQSLTQVIMPSIANRITTVRFTSFRTQMGADILCVYDGPNATSPFLGCFSGPNTLNGQTFKSTHPTGSLTFVFTSNGFTQDNGWVAVISCGFQCQSFTADGDSSSVAPNNQPLQEIALCSGSSIDFVGNAIYPNSGTEYNQSNATSTFEWEFGNGFRQTGQNVTRTFVSPGIFDVNLKVTDTIGCVSSIHSRRVIISESPSFMNIAISPNDTICIEDTVTIEVPYEFIPFQPPVLNNAGTTYLPDGNGVSYYDTINVSIFDPTAIFQTGFLTSVFLNMEHSYLGDLEISLACPSGQRAILKEFPGGGNTFLGEPVDAFPVNVTPGIGYDYSFTRINPTYNTMVMEANTYTQTYTDVMGNIYNNQFYLPSGSYSPFQNINTQLNGCTMNGDWIIRVSDNLGADNGYIFSWGIEFDSLIRPPSNLPIAIEATKDTAYWANSPNIVANPYDSIIRVKHSDSGTYHYTFFLEDDFGCTHDTTITIYVRPKPKSNAGIDDTTCLLTQDLAPFVTPNASANTWDYFTTIPGASANINSPTIPNANVTVTQFGEYNLVLQETLNGCLTEPDTVILRYIPVINTIDIAISDDTICVPDGVRFTNNSDMSRFDNITWEFGNGSVITNNQPFTDYNYPAAGCYDVTVRLSNALGCEVDSLFPNLVCAYNQPIANFTYNPTVPFVPNTLVNFVNLSTDATLFSWDFAGLGNSNNQNDEFEFPKTTSGEYPVTLTVSNEGGCTDQITKTVVVRSTLNMFAPNSFSPNDDGINDSFRVKFNNNSILSYEILIFNRWGEMVAQSNELDFEWDGTYNGTEAPNGVYLFKITGQENSDTDIFEKIGHITLVR